MRRRGLRRRLQTRKRLFVLSSAGLSSGLSSSASSKMKMKVAIMILLWSPKKDGSSVSCYLASSSLGLMRCIVAPDCLVVVVLADGSVVLVMVRAPSGGGAVTDTPEGPVVVETFSP
jgi:hypothetical protein